MIAVWTQQRLRILGMYVIFHQVSIRRKRFEIFNKNRCKEWRVCSIDDLHSWKTWPFRT